MVSYRLFLLNLLKTKQTFNFSFLTCTDWETRQLNHQDSSTRFLYLQPDRSPYVVILKPQSVRNDIRTNFYHVDATQAILGSALPHKRFICGRIKIELIPKKLPQNNHCEVHTASHLKNITKGSLFFFSSESCLGIRLTAGGATDLGGVSLTTPGVSGWPAVVTSASASFSLPSELPLPFSSSLPEVPPVFFVLPDFFLSFSFCFNL